MAVCRSCGASIVWLKTEQGKNIPVDDNYALQGGETHFDRLRHTTHFETCPNAQQHRTKKEKVKND